MLRMGRDGGQAAVPARPASKYRRRVLNGAVKKQTIGNKESLGTNFSPAPSKQKAKYSPPKSIGSLNAQRRQKNLVKATPTDFRRTVRDGKSDSVFSQVL